MNYSIGEFSRISMISIKALRYYHDIGLLQPAHIDVESGYRYYDEASFEKAKLIKLFKDFEFSIREIQEIFDQYEDASDIRSYLMEKHDVIQEKINHYKKLQARIEAFEVPMEENHMTQKVKQVTIKPQVVASITYIGKYQDVGQYIGKLYKALGGNVSGKPFSIYHDDDYKEDHATVEVCMPLKKEIQYKNIETKTLPGGEAIELLHIGPYDRLSDAYKIFTDYIKSEGLKPRSYIREEYLKGPGMLLKGNPEKYQTMIRVLI